MADYYVVEVEQPSGKLLAYHSVPLKTVSEQGFYNEVRSWSAFCNPYYPHRRESLLRRFFVRPKVDHEITVKCWQETCKRTRIKEAVVPEITHATMDDFYKAIGYNRKNKRLNHG